MAEKPMKTPLPADLPESWEIDQIVSPNGAEAGLDEKHGYNYQSRQINAAQAGVNAINEAFAGVEGAVKDAPAKETPADADGVVLVDAGDQKTKKLLWSRVKAVLKGWMDTLYAAAGHRHTAADVGARPDTWVPTAAQVGADPAGSAAAAKQTAISAAASDAKVKADQAEANAKAASRPVNWMPTADQVGARPGSWVPAWGDVTGKPSVFPPSTHTHTKDQVGLGSVPNVGTNDQTPIFSQAVSRGNLVSGEKLSVLFGKLMKWFADLKTVAFSGSYNDLSDKPASMTPTAHKTTHKTGGTDALIPGDIGAAERKTAAGTLSTAGWTGSAGNWSQAVSVSWMLASDVPKARLAGTTAAQMDAWDTLEPYADSAAGKVTFYCKQTAKPGTAMSIEIEVIR